MSRAALVALAVDGAGVDPDVGDADMTGTRTSTENAATAKRWVDVMDKLLGWCVPLLRATAWRATPSLCHSRYNESIWMES